MQHYRSTLRVEQFPLSSVHQLNVTRVAGLKACRGLGLPGVFPTVGPTATRVAGCTREVGQQHATKRCKSAHRSKSCWAETPAVAPGCQAVLQQVPIATRVAGCTCKAGQQHATIHCCSLTAARAAELVRLPRPRAARLPGSRSPSQPELLGAPIILPPSTVHLLTAARAAGLKACRSPGLPGAARGSVVSAQNSHSANT
jgi:hypothetical protein